MLSNKNCYINYQTNNKNLLQPAAKWGKHVIVLSKSINKESYSMKILHNTFGDLIGVWASADKIN
ncbi:unnamed protein product [Debaryomyces tyrocola]|nr:unnamed protein product [Debaryomyces tyrocola]